MILGAYEVAFSIGRAAEPEVAENTATSANTERLVGFVTEEIDGRRGRV